MKILFIFFFALAAVMAIVVFFVGWPLIMGGVETANVSANITEYEGFGELVNYWPFGAFLIVLGLIAFGGYKVLKH